MKNKTNTYLLKKYAIGIDSLSLILKTNDKFIDNYHYYLTNCIDNDVIFVKKDIINSSHRYAVYNLDKLVGYLAVRNGRNRQRYVTFQFLNHDLYVFAEHDILKIIIKIAGGLNFEIINISKIDIFIDSTFCFYEILKNALDTKIEHGDFWSKLSLNFKKKSLSTYTNNYFSIRSYNKSIELKSKSKNNDEPNKAYILDFWSKNKLPKNGMFRFEISLKNKYFKPKNITGIDGISYVIENILLFANKFLSDNLKIKNENNKLIPLFKLNADNQYVSSKKIKEAKILHYASNYLVDFFPKIKTSLIFYLLDRSDDQDASLMIDLMKNHQIMDMEFIKKSLKKYNGSINQKAIDQLLLFDNNEENNYLKIVIPQYFKKLVTRSLIECVFTEVRSFKSNLHSENGGCLRFHYTYH